MARQLNGRRIDDYGQVILEESGLCDILMRGGSISGLCVEETENTVNFNEICRQFDHKEENLIFCKSPDISMEEFDKDRQSKWITPEPYNTINVFEWLLTKCSSDEEQLRVIDEWIYFEKYEMEPVLRFLIYLVDHLREKKIFWGIGRGSSVSSYSLFLIGIHRVNSIKYNLDYREFLK
jgi:DNA polymerase III alpha subunit